MTISVQEARTRRVCKICEESLAGLDDILPYNWPLNYAEVVLTGGIQVSLNYGKDFAHTACLSEPVLAEKLSKKPIPLFDPDADPYNETNLEAAAARGWVFDGIQRVYKDADGFMVGDEFGYPV